jgi:hypothetical protein
MILRVDAAGKISELSLENIHHSTVALPDAPGNAKDARGQNPRLEAITHIAFLNGKVIVAGLSNEEFSSSLRSIPFPFQQADKGSNIEIYHGSHGRFETNAPVRTFVPYTVNNEPTILAAYTCTPLVKIPVAELKPGNKVKGTTIAELGNRNRPLDMIVYHKDGHDFILMSNSSRGVMKINTDQIENTESIAAPVNGKKGLPYETIESWTGVEQLDRLDPQHALVMRRAEGGSLNLESLTLP